MKRWNGWGHLEIEKALPAEAKDMLEKLCGPGSPQPDIKLKTILMNIPESKLADHPLISTDPETRFHFSHGQSFSDWVHMRFGGPNLAVTDGVAFPETEDQVKELLNKAKEEDWCIIPHGAGSSVVGHLTPEGSKPILTISMSRMNRLLDLNEKNHTATFETGVLGPDLEAQIQARGYTLGHFPQSFEFSSLGGWIVTRSSGQQSRYYGRMDQNFMGGTVLMDGGELSIPHFPASSAGPDLRQMIAGSEGRMGILTKATIRVRPLPEADIVYAFMIPGMDTGIEVARRLAQDASSISMLRLSNPTETGTHLAMAGKPGAISALQRYLRFRGLSNQATCLCLIGLTGKKERVKKDLKNIKKTIRHHRGVCLYGLFEKKWKENRFLSAYARNVLWDLGYGVDTLETALPWSGISETIPEVEHAITQFDPERVHVFTHLSHVYDTGSSMYTTYLFPLESDAEANLNKWKKMKHAASKAIIARSGTISHQHGVGTDHAPYLEAEKDRLGMNLIGAVFHEADPDHRFNPGKLMT
jgi:alkyldihydroxyacetonephosphate synthase